jgi:hypothetical protein
VSEKRGSIVILGRPDFRETRRAVASAKLIEYRKQCWRLAGLARQGLVHRVHAVDLLQEVATCHALVRSLGDERITAIISEAFADSDMPSKAMST